MIEIEPQVYKICKCGNTILIDKNFSKNTSYECFNCHRIVRVPNNPEIRYTIKKVKHGTIISKITKKLKSIFSNISFDGKRRLWRLKNENGAVYRTILLYGISSHNCTLSMTFGETIILYLDYNDIHSMVNEINKSTFIWVYDDILNNPENFKKLESSLSYENTLNYSHLEETFDKFMDKVTWQDFEKNFVPQFLSNLQKNFQKLELLLRQLSNAEFSIINQKFIKIGGQGQSDYFTINLKEYLEEGMKPNRFGEIKSYGNSYFSFSDYGKTIAHSLSAPNTIIISTNNVQHEVWVNIIGYKNKYGYYMNVLIDKDLLLYLINAIGLQFLIT